MNDILVRKPLLVDISKYEGYCGRAEHIIINMNTVSHIITLEDGPFPMQIYTIEFTTYNGPVKASFLKKEFRDAVFEDMGKFFA